MTGDMPRPSTRLSSREPARKRRRAPPPLSVTNVFADSRLPDTSEKLWRWPVTSWYFGDVGKADLHITADRPFVKNAAKLPPVEKHYRLRWLEEDATRFVEGEEPRPPEPLPVIPYARQKDTTACARPSKGLGTGVERNAPSRPRKRQCVPKEAPVVEAATISLSNSEVAKPALSANPRPAQLPQNTPVTPVPAQTAMEVEPSATGAKSKPLSVPVKTQPILLRQSKVPPASNFCTPPLSIPFPTVPSPSETIACETPLEKTSTPSPSVQPLPLPKDDAKESTPSDAKDVQDDHEKSEGDKAENDSREEVLLQFVSPVEPRLMGTLTYSLPVNAAPEKEEKEVIVDDPPPEVKQNTFDEEGVYVEDMDLEFRKTPRPFEDAFEDIDTTDELRPEILRLNTLLNGLGPKTKPLRNMINAVVQSEIQRQTQRLEMEAEETRILTRLNEIAKQKATAKAAEKATKAKAKAAARRSSGQVGTQGRPRRPSRKILLEPDSDEDSDYREGHDNGDDGDVKIVSEPVVIVDKPEPILEHKVLDNRKLLLKPEYKAELEELASAILNGAQGFVSEGDSPKSEDNVEPTLGENSAPQTDEGIRHEGNHESAKSEAEKRPDVSPEAGSSVKPTVETDNSKDVVSPVVENKGLQPVQSVGVDTPAAASAIVSPGSVQQLGLDQIGNETFSNEVSPLQLTCLPVEVVNNNNTKEHVRAALAELTYVQPLPGEMVKPDSEDLPRLVLPGSESSPTGESTGDMTDVLQKQLTPLEPVEAEVTTTPITEIDMDATPDSDDEMKLRDTPENDDSEQKMETAEKDCDFASDTLSSPQSKEDSRPCTIFLKDGKIAEQLVRMPSPVSPLQAATPTCGFVMVPISGPTKVLTSGSALVNHMKEIHAEAKKNSLQNGS